MRSLARSPSPDTPSPVPGDIGSSASERAKDLVGRTDAGDNDKRGNDQRGNDKTRRRPRPGVSMTENTSSDRAHVPVLLDRVVEMVAPALTEPGSVVVDATLGLGGHAEALLAAHPHAQLVGLDRDRDALERAGERLAAYGDRFVGVHAVYDDITDVL